MILERGPTRERLQAMLDAAGEKCLVPLSRFTAVRVGGGEKVRSTNRALIWALSGKELPKRGFDAPNCGTKGCCSPDHQVPKW